MDGCFETVGVDEVRFFLGENLAQQKAGGPAAWPAATRTRAPTPRLIVESIVRACLRVPRIDGPVRTRCSKRRPSVEGWAYLNQRRGQSVAGWVELVHR
jgi:hypothetical protein